MKKDREFFLKEAEKLINGQRAKEYGPAKKNHQRIADIWTILLDKKIKWCNHSRGSCGLYDRSQGSSSCRRY